MDFYDAAQERKKILSIFFPIDRFLTTAITRLLVWVRKTRVGKCFQYLVLKTDEWFRSDMLRAISSVNLPLLVVWTWQTKKRGEKKRIAFQRLLTRRYFPTPFCHLSSNPFIFHRTENFSRSSKFFLDIFSLLFLSLRVWNVHIFLSQLLPGCADVVVYNVHGSRPHLFLTSSCFHISHSLRLSHVHSRGLNSAKDLRRYVYAVDNWHPRLNSV
jgi:hypothetical protein